MKRFKYIDSEFSDDIQDPVEIKPTIQTIFKNSFADTVLTKEWRYWETADGISPKIANNSFASVYEANKIVGEINSIPTYRGNLILVEGITIIE